MEFFIIGSWLLLGLISYIKIDQGIFIMDFIQELLCVNDTFSCFEHFSAPRKKMPDTRKVVSGLGRIMLHYM